jgi:hypothetical protein
MEQVHSARVLNLMAVSCKYQMQTISDCTAAKDSSVRLCVHVLPCKLLISIEIHVRAQLNLCKI